MYCGLRQVRSLIAHLGADEVAKGDDEGAPRRGLAVAGDDIRKGLEVATAAYQSAMRGGVPMRLPLEDRRSCPIYPRGYRWGGGDSVGTVQPPSSVSAQGGAYWEGVAGGF